MDASEYPKVCRQCGWNCHQESRMVKLAWERKDCPSFMAFGDGLKPG